MEKKLYGITGIFSTPDSIIAAAEKISNSGYEKYDIHTPYPVHGMDNAMKLKPSKLGYITLVFGLTGAVLALILMYLTMAKDYPMIIGGKPFFALPAFIPVTFEITVLLATLSTVIGMITFFFKFPNNAHSLNDTAYMKAVSGDKFGVCIEADDVKFDETSARELLIGLGAKDITLQYQPEKEIFNALSPKFLVFLTAAAISISGVTYLTLNKVLYVVPFTFMSQQDKISAQSTSEYFPDGRGMQMPVKGTVSRGNMPYIYKDSSAMVTDPVVNPAMSDIKSLELGKRKFLTFCSPCHGNYGEGDGRLRGQFAKAPSLHSQKVKDFQDGNIYHIIMVGQNKIVLSKTFEYMVMPSYANQLTNQEAWSIVNYVRVLQKAKNATKEDIDAVKKEAVANAK